MIGERAFVSDIFAMLGASDRLSWSIVRLHGPTGMLLETF